MSLFGNLLDQAKQAVTRAAQSAVQAVKSTVTTVTNALSTAVTRTTTAIKNTVATVASAAQNVLSGVARGVAGLVGSIADVARNPFASFGNTTGARGDSSGGGSGSQQDDQSNNSSESGTPSAGRPMSDAETAQDQIDRPYQDSFAGQPVNTRVDYRTPITHSPYSPSPVPWEPSFELLLAAQKDPLFARLLRLSRFEGDIMKAVFDTSSSIEVAVEKIFALPPWPVDKEASVVLIKRYLSQLFPFGTHESSHALLAQGSLGDSNGVDPWTRTMIVSGMNNLFSTMSSNQPLTAGEYNAIIGRLINNPDIDQISVLRLVGQAQTNDDQGAFAALIALGLVDAQPNPQHGAEVWSRITGIQYNGESGENLGGNCATFVSNALYVAGVKLAGTWQLGELGSEAPGLYPGAPDFRTSDSVDDNIGDPTGSNVPGVWGRAFYNIDPDQLAQGTASYFRILNDEARTWVPLETEKVSRQLGPGDLFVIDGESDHVALVVGFGLANGGSNAAFYPTYDDAVEAAQRQGRDPADVVPYAVDHGGANPAGYPRPIGLWTGGNNKIYIRDVGYDPE